MSQETRTIAWVGGQFFQARMEAEGFRVRHIPILWPETFTWEDIVARCGCAPDAVVYADRSMPPPLLGVERFPCLTAFYCIDSHIHGWYPLYAGSFDLCAVSLRDHVERFAAELPPGRVIWLPPCAEDRYQPHAAEKEFDLLFAGTVDPETTPQRHDFLKRLSALFPGLAVRQGDFNQLLPRARVVLNIAERGDLNFRVFEALACGACLLTPRIANGQAELFNDGGHFVLYEPDDAADAAAKARALLADDSRRKALALAGFTLVNDAHRPAHRAQAFAALLRQGFDKAFAARRLAHPDAALRKRLRLMYLHWAENSGAEGPSARYLAEAQAKN